ncbi:ureidoglycolate lyase [Vibrio hepatarius]|uniref:ureidoglycolate lyase n=1 Tax=Vibrio hepatarius TaxID=171383 RepID=UPI001C08A39D|nr:ureidoglycolate lyase [Vibrio hepatarius]MBU2896632.1 ureidoglycolate lyase [Vibrio hepatarius]
MACELGRLKIEPLTAQTFAQFGEVIEIKNRDYSIINNGMARRYHKLAVTDVNDEDGNAVISIFKAKLPSYPFTIKVLERHPLGTQAFIPLDGNPFLIIVAPKGDFPTLSQSRAFVTNGHQGVNYFKGVWHHPLLTLVEGDQLLVVDRDGKGSNCETVIFDKDLVELHLADIP